MGKLKPRVLVFIDWFLPGYKAGGPVTSNVNIVEHLRNEVDFFILTRDTDYCDNEPYDTVIPNQWTHSKEGMAVFYFSKEFLTISNLKKVAIEAQCSLWYVNGIYSFYFSIFPVILSSMIKDVRIIVSARGMISPHSIAVKPLKKKLLLWLFRFIRFYQHADFHATNEKEAVEISKQAGKCKAIHVAPNLPKVMIAEKPSKKFKESGVVKLVSIGRISPEKNTLGALKIISHCVNPTIQLDFYGQVYDLDYKSQCDEVVLKMPKNVCVNFFDSISPDLITSVLEKAHFLYLPTHGENFGHAILEALMAGCPVIISDQTPWKDLNAKGIGWDISLEEPDQFVNAIEFAAVMNQFDYDKMSNSAFSFAKSIITNPEVMNANRKLFGIL